MMSTIVTRPNVATVITQGLQGPRGISGTSNVQRVASSAIAGVRALRTTGATQQVATATTSLRTLPFAGVSVAAADSGATVTVIHHGPLDPTVLSLGAGVACAVGVTSAGVPVRATDATCVSAPNWLGRCDASGTIYVAPNNPGVLLLSDFGAATDGTTNDAAALTACIDVATAVNVSPGVYGGQEVVFPEGVTKIVAASPFTVPSHCTVRGTGLSKVEHDIPGGCMFVMSRALSNGFTNNALESLWLFDVSDAATAASVAAANHTRGQVEILGGGGILIRDVKFDGGKYGVAACGVNNLTIDDCVFGTQSRSTAYPYPVAFQTTTNTSPIVVHSVGHRFQTGDRVYLTGERGNTAANGPHTVGATTGSTYELAGTTGNGEHIAHDGWTYAYYVEPGDTEPRTASVLLANGYYPEWVTLCTEQGAEYLIGAGGITNRVTVKENQVNGHAIGVWHQDGANHLVFGNNFNALFHAGAFSGFQDCTWRSNEMEACWSDAYFAVFPYDEDAAQLQYLGGGLTIDTSASSGIWGGTDHAGCALLKVASNATIQNLRVRDNGFYSGTGTYALIQWHAYAHSGVYDVRGNYGHTGLEFSHEPGDSGGYSEAGQDGDDRYLHGINAPQPGACLDVRTKGSGPAALRLRAAGNVFEQISATGNYRERGVRQGYDLDAAGFQEYLAKGDSADGAVTIVAFERADGTTGDITLPRFYDAGILEVTVIERRTSTARAVVHRLERVFCKNTTLALATTATADRSDEIGAAGSWNMPTVSAVSEAIRVTVNAPTGDSSTWGAHVVVRRRAVF